MTNAVLVTGASSGIGAATIGKLDAEGFQVYAGVRKERDFETILNRSGGSIRPLILDVTQPETIEAAVELIGEKEPQGLVGLVNNAGIAVSGPLETIPMDEVKRQFDVNVFGQLCLTQHVLGQLKKSDAARIINVSSVSGLLALPMVGPYAASKFALEALTDSLRQELRHTSVRVCLIEPGVVETPIWQKSEKDDLEKGRLVEGLDEVSRERYLGLMSGVEGMKSQSRPTSAEFVAEVIHDAITARRPKARYQIGTDAKLAAGVVRCLPTRWKDSLIRRAIKRGQKAA